MMKQKVVEGIEMVKSWIKYISLIESMTCYDESYSNNSFLKNKVSFHPFQYVLRKSFGVKTFIEYIFNSNKCMDTL